jgi:hypothetical protein
MYFKKRHLYNGYTFNELNDKFIKSTKLKLLKTDSEFWRSYYKSDESNWIAFYPFSEYHGGGQPYIIMIRNDEHDDWIDNNPNFESEIRKLIEKQ